MAPKRRASRKAGAAAQVSTNKTAANQPAGYEDGGAACAGQGPSKRKRRTSVNIGVEPEAGPTNSSGLVDIIAQVKKIMESTEEVDQLCLMQQDLLQLRKHLQVKIQERRAFQESVKAKDELQLSIREGLYSPPHPLMNEVILKRLAMFISPPEQSICRLVCTTWNRVLSQHLRQICWTTLTFDPPCPPKPTDSTARQGMPLQGFLTGLAKTSSLFPFTQFALLLNKVPPAVTEFFSIYSEFIKRLELRYQPPPITTTEVNQEIQRMMNMNAIQRLLLPAIPNCEHLYLVDLSCQLFANTETVVPKKLNLKHLEVEMICKCEHDENKHFMTSNTFLTKLIMHNQHLETVVLFLNSKNFSEIGLRRMVLMVLSHANLDRLKSLTLRSENLVQLNWVEDQPANFQLKALELGNVILWPLNTFLEHHANTLESLTFEMNQEKWDVLRRDFAGQVYSAPILPHLHSLNVVCLEDQEEHLNGILKAEILPEIKKLAICFINDTFTHAHSINRNSNNDSDTESDDEQEAGYENQIQVKSLQLDIDEQDSPSDFHFLRHTFYGVQHLILTTCQSRFITPLWTSGFPLKSLELHVTFADHDRNDSDEFYIQHLDTIITGFSVNDCERVYQHIQRTSHSPEGFQLATVNTDVFDLLCKDKEYPSIRNLSRLQRLEIVCSRNSSRLTEVTLAIVLLWLKNLTAITISNCCISQNFVKNIREQLPAGFYLDIDGVDV